MVKIMKLAVIFLAVMGMGGLIVSVSSQEQTKQGSSISVPAEVASISLIKSEVVIKIPKDPINNIYEKRVISVLPETTIFKGDESLQLSDLKVGDKIIVKYTANTLGKWKAETITVEAVETNQIE